MPDRLAVVVGPPAGGKSTYVTRHKDPADLVIDCDALAKALGGPHHAPHGAHRGAAQQLRRILIDKALAGAYDKALNGGAVWIIHTRPPAGALARYRAAGADLIVVDPGRSECIAQAARDNRPPGTTGAILAWYADPPHVTMRDVTTVTGTREW
jgi:Predicted kinase